MEKDYHIAEHLLRPSRQFSSPHCEARPNGEISLLVLHSISLPPGGYGTDYVRGLFMGELDPAADESFVDLQGLRVSAHLFIRRDGQPEQFVRFDRAAWHAGESCYQGREGCNAFSIGIELEGARDDDYEDEQYAALAGICRTLLATYPEITAERIVGHKDIAPGRKDDPWNFEWDRFRQQLKTEL